MNQPEPKGDMVEVGYWRHVGRHLLQVESVQEALAFINAGEDEGRMWCVGVFVNGQPHVYGGYVEREPPTPEQAEEMRKFYREAAHHPGGA